MTSLHPIFNFLVSGTSAAQEVSKFSQESYHVINNPDGSPRWIYSTSLRSPLFLKFYPITGMRSRLIQFAFSALFYTGLIRLIRKTVDVDVDVEGAFFKKYVKAESKEQWALFAGTLGPNQKIVMYQKTSDGRGVFTKIAYGENAKQLVNKEQIELQFLHGDKHFSFLMPKVLDHDAISVSIDELHLTTGSVEFTQSHALALGEMYQFSTAIEEIKSAHYHLHEETQNEEARELLTDLRKGVLELAALADQKKKRIKIGYGHGDFTPWNVGFSHDKLAVLDWELAGTYPLLYDAFHFVLQNQIMTSTKNTDEIYAQIKLMIAQPAIQTICKTHAINWKDQFVGYLLDISTFYYSVYAKQGALHYQAIRAIKVWIDFLQEAKHELQMMTHRTRFLNDFFERMRDEDYALMKNANERIDQMKTTSDVDVVIRKADLAAIQKWIKTQKHIHKIHVATNSYMKVLSIYFADGSFLSMDFIYQFKRKALHYLKVEDVLASSSLASNGMKQPSPQIDIQYMVLFYFLNGAVIPLKYFHYFSTLSKESQASIVHYLEQNLVCKVNSFGDLFDSKSIATLRPQLFSTIKGERENKNIRGLLNRVRYTIDSLKSFVNRHGMVITFSGVDGAGKSTIINHVKEKLEKKYRKKVVVLRHRPSVLPILSAWVHGKEQAEKKSAATLPRQGTNKNYISSLLRFSYYLVDFLFGQFVIWFKYVLRGHIVLYDRYYFDFIEDPKRSNIHLPKWFCKLFYRLIYKPQLNVFLYAQAEEIIKRKQELSIEDIVQLTSSYKGLFQEFSKRYQEKYVAIENTDLQNTLDTIETLFVDAA